MILVRIIQKILPDEIYNLACPASPIHYQNDPVQTTKTSVHGAINMLGLAKRLGIKILQASTSEVYGDPEIHPQPENYWGNVNPIGQRSCYDEGKRLAETLFFDYHRMRGVDIRVARIFNTYGPRMKTNDGRVVPNFVAQALADRIGARLDRIAPETERGWQGLPTAMQCVGSMCDYQTGVCCPAHVHSLRFGQPYPDGHGQPDWPKFRA